MSDTAPAAAPAATAPEGQQPATPAAPAATPPATPAPAPKPAAPAAPAEQPKAAEVIAEPWNDPAAAKAEIEKLRKENGDARVNAKAAAKTEGQTELAKALAPLLGIELPGEQAATPEQLTQQVTTVTTERDTARFDAAVAQAAWAAGIDPSKADYLAFKLSKNPDIAGADPTSAEFAGKLKASIDGLMAEDATLKRSGTVQASGVEAPAGSGGSDTITPEKFANMSMAERTKLYQTDRATYDRLTGNA